MGLWGMPEAASSSFGGGGGGYVDIGGSLVTSTVGGLLANDMNKSNADHAMDRSDAMARSEMAFQERMSNTAYQRATADMKAAGINPMVAYQQGGASTPQGAMGQSHQAAPVQNFLAQGLSSAMDAVRLKKELGQAGSQIALNGAMATNQLAQAGAAGSSAKLTELNSKSIASQLDAIKKEAEARSKKAGYDTKFGDFDAINSRANSGLGTAKKVFDMITPSGGGKLGPNEMKINSNTGEILQEGRP